MLWLGSGRDSGFLVSFMESRLAFIVPGVLTPVIMWIGLRKWQRAIEQGDRVWFLEWTPVKLVAVLLLLYFAKGLSVDVRPSTERLASLFHHSSQQFPWALYAMALLINLMGCGVIFWWCDRPPRRSRAIAYTFAAWVATVLAPSLLFAGPVHVRLFTDIELSFPPSLYSTSLGQLPIFGAMWHVGLSVIPVPGVLQMLTSATSLAEIAHRLLSMLVEQRYSLLPGTLVAVGFFVVRYRQGGVPIRSYFGTRMSDLMDMMPMEEDEHRRGGPDGD